jgi:hypothetical protein
MITEISLYWCTHFEQTGRQQRRVEMAGDERRSRALIPRSQSFVSEP